MLALVALGIVYRLRPAWLAVPLSEAARQEHVSVQRLSRLVTAVIAGFEGVLAALTRRGRPLGCHDDNGSQTELALTRELLGVASALLARLSLRRRDLRDLVVGTWRRLSQHKGMTQRRFCEALAQPDRTLRAWLACPAASPPPSPPALPLGASSKRPPLRRRRFGFDVTLPGTPVAADTTDIEVFGVGLKLVGAQDVGGGTRTCSPPCSSTITRAPSSSRTCSPRRSRTRQERRPSPTRGLLTLPRRREISCPISRSSTLRRRMETLVEKAPSSMPF